MSKRLQVLVEEDELQEIQRAARRERLTVAEWVRQALREVRRQRPQASLERKLAAIRKAAEYAAPTADIDQMLAEIGRGYQRGGGVIFIDSNIPMYVIGRPHPHREGAQRLLERAAVAGERLVTDAEVLQEILHRYDALTLAQCI